MKTRKLLLAVAFLFVAGIVTSAAQSVFMSSLADANGNQLATNVMLDPANSYILDLKYYVIEGQTLTIPAGTVIKATYGTGLAAPALIITRGAQLFANGTSSAPVVFTTIEDLLDGQYPIKNQGRWGGVIMLGRAYNNVLEANALGILDGEGTIEGLDIPDPRHHYGQDRWESQEPEVIAGTQVLGSLKPNGDFNNADNSGSLTYVSIRHGGAVIGTDNEINGLTLGSVGSLTVLENIEIVSNQDDGIEFFGGTVNIKRATILFCNDDYIDWDHGYTGNGQFIYGLQLPASTNPVYVLEGDNGLEIDGDDDDIYNDATLPAGVILSNPTFYNVTMIGNGADDGIEAKERTQGTIANSIFANFSNGIDLNTESDRPVDGYHNWLGGSLVVANNLFAGNTNMVAVGGTAADAATVTAFEAQGNAIDNGVIDYTLTINALTNAISNSVDPVPAAGAAVATSVAADLFFETAAYAGAFEPGAAATWVDGWSAQEALAVQCPSDLNNDGITDTSDFLEFLPQFSVICGQ